MRDARRQIRGDQSGCRRLAADTVEVAGSIDIIVNNAVTSKFVRHSDLEALSEADYLVDSTIID